ncbi:MAG TPA: hypothetical protein VGJ82_12315 [Thermoanaerobaculia bacterium]|jgi:tetratricopeptide (TPR) repeat protein
MIDGHYEDYELLAYRDRDADMLDVPSADAHISMCEECTERLRAIRRFEALLSDKNVHDYARRLRSAPPAMDAFVVATDDRLRADVDAERTLARLGSVAIDAWPEWLAFHPSRQTPGLVLALLGESRRHLNDRPETTLRVIAIAEEIANAQTDVFDLAECRGNVELQRANALRHLGRYDEALAAADAAYRFLAHLPAPTYDLAFASWARANVLFSMTRYAEALPLIRDATETFLIFGDLEHANRARVVEASLLCEQGDVERSEQVYRALLTFFENAGDTEMIARLSANLADCAVRLDHASDARLFAAQATQLFATLGRPSEATRVRWSLGNLLMRHGAFEDALGELEAAAEDFQQRGMIATMGEVLLDIVEIYLRRTEWVEAEALARTLAGVFRSAHAPLHHAQAYAYLRDALANRSATVDLVASVRAFVTGSSETDAFAPPLQ